MPWINGQKVKCCKICGGSDHTAWKCPQNVPKSSTRTSKAVKPKKVSSRSNLVKLYDREFSDYIKKKAILEGELYCFTCGKKLTYQTAVAMHFYSRKFVGTRWNTDNVKVGCFECNAITKHQPEVHARYAELLEEKVVSELSFLKNQKPSLIEIEAEREVNKQRLKEVERLIEEQS